MINIIKDYNILFISTIILITVDISYLYLNQLWYKKEIQKMQGYELNLKWSGVILRYLSQIIGLNIFVLQRNGTLLDAFIYGIIIYSNYIGTNYATVNDFDETLAAADLLKGGMVMVLTTFFTYTLI
jgi:uncharacterized membrane protein